VGWRQVMKMEEEKEGGGERVRGGRVYEIRQWYVR
jgi:hypothetical protein